MSSQNNRIILFTVMLLGAGILFFNPFGGPPKPPATILQSVETETITSYSDAFKKDARDARATVLDIFDTADLLVMGEFLYIRDQIEFLRSMLPSLAQKGIDIVAVEFLRMEDQAEIDALLAGINFDENLAKQLLVRRNPFFAYKEYLDFMRSVWDTNQTSKDKKLQILGLSSPWNQAAAEKASTTPSKANYRNLFPHGLPDQQMAKLLSDKVLSTGKKAIAWVQKDAAILGFDEPNYKTQIPSFGLGDGKRLTRMLFELYGTRVASAWFHDPWQAQGKGSGLVYPASGLIDNILKKLDKSQWPQWPVALRLDTSMLGRYTIIDSDYTRIKSYKLAEEDPKKPGTYKTKDTKEAKAELPKFGDFATIYIMTGPISEQKSYTVIEGLITEDNFEKVLQHIPMADRKNTSITKLQENLLLRSEQIQKALEALHY